MAGSGDSQDELCLKGIRAYQSKDLEGASRILEQVVAADPCHVRALNALAVVAMDMGEYQKSFRYLDRILKVDPNYEKALNTRALTFMKLGKYEEAETDLRKAISNNPSFVEAYGNLAEVQLLNRRWAAAEEVFDRILTLAPAAPQAWYGRSKALVGKGLVGEAIQSLEKSIELKPDYAQAWAFLGLVKLMQHEIEGAVSAIDSALRYDDGSCFVLDCAGSVLVSGGDVDNAVELFRRCLKVEPDIPVTHSKLLISMHYSSECSPAEILEEAKSWNDRHALEAAPPRTVRKDGPLRIGFLSTDFREHVIIHFFEHLLESMDRTRFRVHCYSNVTSPDATTVRLQGLSDGWTDIHGMTDREAAQAIAADGIDILFDLTGHTANNRMQLLTLKPAPIQISWMGYPGTTGVKAMDYRLTDGIADPEGMTERYFTEKLLRLDGCFLCYRPEQVTPDVLQLPARSGEGVTFGSFNFIGKITREMLALWAELLCRIPDSRLVLKSKWFLVERTREKVLQVMAKAGVAAERISFLSFQESRWDHLNCYNQIDIALDTFPYNGTTTTFESLWMGVPVVTLAGESHVSRVGASILANLELDDLVAHTADEYVSIAAGLAQDLGRLETLRKTLRERLASSLLCDAEAYARKMEKMLLSLI